MQIYTIQGLSWIRHFVCKIYNRILLHFHTSLLRYSKVFFLGQQYFWQATINHRSSTAWHWYIISIINYNGILIARSWGGGWGGGMVVRFHGDDHRFWDVQSNWIPILCQFDLNDPLFLQKKVTLSSRDTWT